MFDQASSPDTTDEVVVTKTHARLTPHPYLSDRGVAILEDVAAWLEAGAPERGQIIGFDLGSWIETLDGPRGCGTYCCIAGAVVEFSGEPYSIHSHVAAKACKLLSGGKDDDEHYYTFDKMFVPQHGVEVNGDHMNPYKNDPQWAARVVRKFIATGEVDWAGTAAG